jgi:hypothetical protein
MYLAFAMAGGFLFLLGAIGYAYPSAMSGFLTGVVAGSIWSKEWVVTRVKHILHVWRHWPA